MYNIFNKYKSRFIFFIKLIIVGAAFYFISFKISDNKTFTNTSFLDRLHENILNNYSILLIIVLFTLVNWVLEIIKWQTLVSAFKSINIFEASKQSLSSLTASLLTPNRIGEYGAKAIYYSKLERPKILVLNFLGNTGQMVTTIFFGMIGLFFFKENLSITFSINSLKWMVFAAITLFIFVSTTKKYW
ncbi:MAG: flippase-like domain-containing protein, partial [Flavobacteriaceae bacterium]|nr:flippase-like domain-containing protein [Flavobacteriaceae bacterium]